MGALGRPFTPFALTGYNTAAPVLTSVDIKDACHGVRAIRAELAYLRIKLERPFGQ